MMIIFDESYFIPTQLIFIESPTNPLLKVCDIKAIAEIAKKNGAHLAVDNTFLTPYFQRPLELGADFSVYSLTKYMNGHSDVVMGAVVTNNTEMYNKLRFLQNGMQILLKEDYILYSHLFLTGMGIIPGPFDCALITRSLKTLPIRMKTHNANALIVAKFLESHPRVLKVVHPGK